MSKAHKDYFPGSVSTQRGATGGGSLPRQPSRLAKQALHRGRVTRVTYEEYLQRYFCEVDVNYSIQCRYRFGASPRPTRNGCPGAQGRRFLDVEQGDFLSRCWDPNGAGKTTLIGHRHFARQQECRHGRRVRSRPSTGIWRVAKSCIGVVPQETKLQHVRDPADDCHQSGRVLWDSAGSWGARGGPKKYLKAAAAVGEAEQHVARGPVRRHEAPPDDCPGR